MRQRMANQLVVKVEGVDLTQITKPELYLSQPPRFFQYTPTIVSATELLVNIPYDDAMQFKRNSVSLQLAFTGADGVPDATEPVEIPVGTLLKEAGYDPS